MPAAPALSEGRVRRRHTGQGQGKRCERSYLLGKYISSLGRETGFAQERIRKMHAREGGEEEEAYHSKIDSLLLPDCLCVPGERTAGLPRLGREEGHEENNDRSGREKRTERRERTPVPRVTIKVTSLLDQTRKRKGLPDMNGTGAE